MKTSASQFECMVSFMEEHGDITKPNSDASGRLRSLMLWEQLGNLLNSDGGGVTRTIDKWKKVWSDFKNNTKKKAARLHRAAIAIGGGPDVFAKLTDLEQRVLQLVGAQSATGLPVEEAGLYFQIINQPAAVTSPPPASPLTQLDADNNSCEPDETIENATQSQTLTVVKQEVLTAEYPDTLIPERPTTPPATSPSLSGQTLSSRVPRHARGTRARASRRRYVRPAHTEQAAQHCLHSDEEWRKFRIRQHQDYMENKREANRIRTMELEGQREWRALGARVLDIIEKVVNKSNSL